MVSEDNLSNKERKEVKKEIALAAHQQLLEKAKNAKRALNEEFKKQASGAIITAFGLVIALAWKDLVTSLIPSIAAPGLIAKYPYLAQLYTAIIITVFAVVGIMLISRWAKKPIQTA